MGGLCCLIILGSCKLFKQRPLQDERDDPHKLQERGGEEARRLEPETAACVPNEDA